MAREDQWEGDQMIPVDSGSRNPKVDEGTDGKVATQCASSIVHVSADAPLCSGCRQSDVPFFDPCCTGCMDVLKNPETTISEIYAIIRQWVPQTQRIIDVLVDEVLSRGANVNDRDGLTDMALLHYACKAGASGVGDAAVATRTVGFLLDKGADLELRCRWTDMAAIHYAVYFDVASVLELILKNGDDTAVNSPCREFDGGTPLHIAAANFCVEAVKLLVGHGANLNAKDELGRLPIECIPDSNVTDSTPDLQDAIENLHILLKPSLEYGNVSGRTILQSMGLQIGDKVTVGSTKMGVLRFCGTTQFSSGLWAGVELDEPLGKNDGTVNGICYFKCPPHHGIFAPLRKISRSDSISTSNETNGGGRQIRHVNHPKIDVSQITSKVETGLGIMKRNPSIEHFSAGDRVRVAGGRRGTVRFVGETTFSKGFWYGIELDRPTGKNDGTVNGVSYFSCKANHGLFTPARRVSGLSKGEDELSDQGSSGDLTTSRSSNDADFSGTSFSSPYTPRRSMRRPKLVQNGNAPPKNCWLTLGVNVFVNNEIGVVRFMGEVKFAEGIWLGIELRTPCGKNDGSIDGHRYFSCKTNHGLLVRPGRVTVRGINGSKLLPRDLRP